MKELLAAKYLKPALYVVGAIAALYIIVLVFRLFKRVTDGAKAAAGIAADKAENEVLAQQTGLSTVKVDELRETAFKVADEMATRKGLDWWDRNFYILNRGSIVNWLNAMKSADEMRIVKNFYEKLYTDSRSLYDDLNDKLGETWFVKVKFKAATR